MGNVRHDVIINGERMTIQEAVQRGLNPVSGGTVAQLNRMLDWIRERTCDDHTSILIETPPSRDVTIEWCCVNSRIKITERVV